MQRRTVIGIIVSAALVVSVGLVGAASASAVVFTRSTAACTGGINVALCGEDETTKAKFELEGDQSTTESGGAVILTGLTVPQQVIVCEKATGSGTIMQKEPLAAGKKTTMQGILKYEGCKLSGEPAKKCVVNVNNETKELLGTLENEKELKLVPKAGTVFLEITYTNNGAEKCPATFLGSHTVTGSQVVEIVNPGVAEATKKVKAIGETLEFLSAKAELSQELTLTFTGLCCLVYPSKEA
jgi:hypothetical protein